MMSWTEAVRMTRKSTPSRQQRMPPSLASVALFSLLLLLQIPGASATYWTVTYYKVRWFTTQGTATSTLTRDLANTSSLPSATASTPYTTISPTVDLTVVNVYYAKDDVPNAPLAPSATSSTRPSFFTTTSYIVPTVFTAPAQCETPFNYTTTVPITVPPEVTAMYTPTSTRLNSVSPGMTVASLFLPTNAITKPETDFPIWVSYVQSCSNPATWVTPTPTGRIVTYPSSQYYYSSPFETLRICTNGVCVKLKDLVIGLAAALVASLLLGLAESWFWFARLMAGQWCLRGGGVIWVLSTAFVLACFVRRQPARTAHDRYLLRRRWRTLSRGEKFRLWRRWGLRRTYPVEVLGDPQKSGDGADADAGSGTVDVPPLPPPPPPPPPPSKGAADNGRPSSFELGNLDFVEQKVLVMPGQDMAKFRGAPFIGGGRMPKQSAAAVAGPRGLSPGAAASASRSASSSQNGSAEATSSDRLAP